MNTDLQEKILTKVRGELDGTAHHVDHTLRVCKNAEDIAGGDQAVDLNILQTACMLHDVARKYEDEDTTGQIDHALMGAEMVKSILKGFNYSDADIKEIQHCIASHRFRNNEQRPVSREAQILFDADKLDLTGAVGIARMFMMAGQFRQSILACANIEDYRRTNLVGGKSDGKVIDMPKHSPYIEFETKIKNLSPRLFTERGKQMAAKQIAFMAAFFAKLKSET